MLLIRKLLTFFIITGVLSCGASYEEPDSAIEAGRQFINAIYNGNFKRAGELIVQDETNSRMLKEDIEKDFRSRNSFAKDSLSKTSIQINKITNIDSLTTVMEFTNAYHNHESVLLIKKENGLWRVKIEKIK